MDKFNSDENIKKKPQTQSRQPGSEAEMQPRPETEKNSYRGSGKLKGKIALITGGDSGIGSAVAVAFAKEGADVIISYLDEQEDALNTQRLVQEKGQRCELLPGDIQHKKFCVELVETCIEKFGRLDILVNNAAKQYERKDISEITPDQLQELFGINFFSFVYLTQAALKYMKKGATIINSASVNAYKGNALVLDYTCTKGAIVAFTRSMCEPLLKKGIRINAVAPGPVWTPLIPSSLKSKEKVAHFGEEAPMQRAAEPSEIAPSYVFLASDDSSYMSGQVLHPNGGTIVNG